MQVAKDDIKNRILEAAKAEFLENGYEKASIRSITAKANTSKSNLYNYFRDKDDLFFRLLEPTVIQIREGLTSAEQFNLPKGVVDYTKDSQMHVVGIVYEFVGAHFVEVSLLLFKAQGSSLASFREEVLEAFTDNMCRWAGSFGTGRQLSRLFVRSVCGFYLSLIEQAILFGKSEEMAAFGREFSTFVYNGWRSVLEAKEGGAL